MLTKPKMTERPEQHYVGIRARVTMEELGRVVPPLWPEVFAWLGERGMAAAGPPFIRYLIVNMEGELEVDAGVPVTAAVSGDERVQPGVLPAGPYATLIHTGPPEDLVAANAALLRWGAESGAEWQMSGERWAARLESSLTDPSREPDRNKWQTEVAYLTA